MVLFLFFIKLEIDNFLDSWLTKYNFVKILQKVNKNLKSYNEFNNDIEFEMRFISVKVYIEGVI